MRKNIFVLILSTFLLFSLSGLASSAWFVDTAGDALLPGYDIDQTNIELWQPTAGTWYMKVSMDMAAGDKTPGVISIELDVDGDAGTGGNVGMGGYAPTCITGPPPTAYPGMDILIFMVNRVQAPDANLSFCNGCGICPNAGETNDTCTSPLDSCGDSRKQGEWYAVAMVGGQNATDVERGRVDLPLAAVADTVDGDVCITIDYSRLVQSAYDDIAPTEIKRFNLAKAQDPGTYLQYKLAAWHSTTWGVDGDDFIGPADCHQIVDMAPDDGALAAAEVKPADCTANLNNGGPSAGKVGIFDLLIMKTQYGWGTSGNPECFMGNCE